MFDNVKNILLGKPQDPFSKESRRSIALIAFLAWIGLGADGLSSSCYGPELGYLALGHYQHLALFLALLTAFTVFLIALSYNQVIELFPNGGGGYKVANTLLGPLSGLVSGTALIIDYMLTISISIASGIEAIFSLLPAGFQSHKVLAESLVVIFLMFLNLRGMKESIKFLLPIFLGFFFTHIAIITYGIFVHGNQLPGMVHTTIVQTHSAINNIGFIAIIAILLRAYSLGSGTYTGLEAVSNNVNMLAEPRVRTGRLTMMYMAISLSLVASGIILLYLLWHVEPIRGMTLNAVVFQQILGHSHMGHLMLIVLLFFEAGLLLVGGNTGFLGGPAVLANMALDKWVPRRFATLSSRLVKQNGVLFFGISAIFILILTGGSIHFLVILYSINVFITFSLSLLGLTVYWWNNRGKKQYWLRRLSLSLMGLTICVFILFVIIITKFDTGSWVAILATAVISIFCYFLKRYYKRYESSKKQLDKELKIPLKELAEEKKALAIDPAAPTAVFLVKGIGGAMHTMLWVERMFPKHFKNYIFVSYGVVDTGSFGSEAALTRLKSKTERITKYLTHFANQNGIAAISVEDYGANPMTGISDMMKTINEKYKNNVCFAAEYIYTKDRLFSRFMHSDFTENVQHELQALGMKLLIVPLNVT